MYGSTTIVSSHLTQTGVGIDSPFCKEGNEVSSKTGAQVILRGILNMPIDLDAIPATGFPYDPEMDTIAEASRVPQAGNVVVEEES